MLTKVKKLLTIQKLFGRNFFFIVNEASWSPNVSGKLFFIRVGPDLLIKHVLVWLQLITLKIHTKECF